MRSLATLFGMCLLATAGTAFAQAQPQPQEPRADAPAQEMDLKPAMAAASAWLALVDAGLYGRSWDDAAPLLQEKVARLQWEVMMQDIHGKLGMLQSRKLASATFTPSPVGAPPGEYVVIQHHSTYADRPLTTEILTPMRQKDGTWRVSGYFIR
jgi:hypothetical protein